MDHKVLYKDNRYHVPRQHKQLNRELQESNRNKSRRDRFQHSRNISPSHMPESLPVLHKKEVVVTLVPENKENAMHTNHIQNANSTLLAKIVCQAKNPEKLSKQEAFIKRFLEWKENKKDIKKREDLVNKKKPFVSAVNSCSLPTSSTLVPKEHHKGFRPPEGMKNPIDMEKDGEHKALAIKGRQSIYTAVLTPPRKHFDEKCKNKFPNARKVLPTNSITTKNISSNLSKNTRKPTSANKLKKMVGEKSIVLKSPVLSKAKVAAVNMVRTLEKAKTSATSISSQPVYKKPVQIKDIQVPPPPRFTRSATKASNSSTGAAAKLRTLAQKRTEFDKKTKISNLKTIGANLAQNLKAKKLLNVKRAENPSLQLNGKKIMNLLNINGDSQDMIIQTPRDFATLNPFDEFVTSTKIKNSNQIMENMEGTSPINLNKKSHRISSAKRNILQNEEKSEGGGLKYIGKKHNFIRYSEVANITGIDHIENDEVQTLKVERKSISSDDNTLVNNDEKTPTKSGAEEAPANYLSPFVSVTRGKVSLKKENEKRNSVYLQNITESNDLPKESSPTYSVEVRRTLEAVKYFRKQLENEIERLHKLCDIWEVYKKENMEKIKNANGEDMINVTTGQTRLLTSKKFMQFKGLIERCEAGATGIGVVEYDGSEDTKPITSADLEGFWSMLGLQVDNLDKRFENLNRWKENEWQDPDEEKPKNKNPKKVKKTTTGPTAKAKPNLALQRMLRKMQAEMRKNKNKNDGIDEVVITTSDINHSVNSNTTPRKSSNTDLSRRLSITVRDRKYFSPAATVISIRKSSQDSPKLIKHIQKFNEAIDCMQTSLGLRKSVLINESSRSKNLNSVSPTLDDKNIDAEKTPLASTVVNNKQSLSHESPLQTGRKSILKTPGTAKSRLRNVIFNEKLRVKKFNFLINEDGDNFNDEQTEGANHTHEEDLAKNIEEEPLKNFSPQRTLTLRSRKVHLRPSCEIVIPHK